MERVYPRVRPVGDRAVTVELGGSLDAETVGRVRALDLRVAEARLEGVLECVPTFASLLVLYDRTRVVIDELSDRLLRLAERLDASDAEGRLVRIPVLYDGEDLGEIAERARLSRDAVVAVHSETEYRALMLGFSPGFAYMGFVDERLRFPRRSSPRTRVPAGSVAIAGVQTGVYPRSLPGGWNLLGRTSMTLFSPERDEPSAVRPGDRVRFEPVSSLAPRAEEPVTRYDGHGVSIDSAGVLTTIQDHGRHGLRRLSVPSAGFADDASARRANRCVGNELDSPLVEICGPPVRMRFDTSSFVAVTGQGVDAILERSDLEAGFMPMPPNVAVRVRGGNTLVVRGLGHGARAYVAIAGLRAPRVLGSASVDLASAFLRPLRSGDGLTIGAFDADRPIRDPARVPARSFTVRVVLGPQDDYFDQDAIDVFLRTAWTVGLDSDRVGARLDGARIRHKGPTEIVSDGMVPGCIQVPPDGRPIAMLSDCPTTGGYPKIACVVSDDLGILAQAIPGQSSFRFVQVAAGAPNG